MNEQPGLSDQFPRASPWPLFVALGFALSEVGVFLGLFPVAVGGLLLFGASVAGILRESGYVNRPWLTVAQLGVLFAGLGGLIVGSQVDIASVAVLEIVGNSGSNGVISRGVAIIAAGLMLVAAGGTGAIVERTVPSP